MQVLDPECGGLTNLEYDCDDKNSSSGVDNIRVGVGLCCKQWDSDVH